MAVAVAVAAVALAVALNGRDERAAPPAKSALVFRVEPAGSAAAGDTARVLRERLTAAGVDRADVTVGRDGSTLTVTAPTAAREDVVALARRGRVAIYDWERSVLRADGRRAVAAPSSARSPDAYYAGAMTRRQAAVLAARPAGGRPVRDDRRDEWFVLAGTPALSDREIESAAAITTFGEQPPSVAIQFTARGETAFTALTPEIAHRGRERAADGLDERDAWQHLVIAIDEQIVAVPYINGRENPDGILAGTGTQIQGGLTRKTARQIAAIIDSGPLPAALSSATAAAPTTHPAMNATERLSRERRAQIMDRLMAMLEEHHRFSERIEPVAPTMLARQAAGAYNDLEESARATAVTTTLRHASDDDRLGVRFTAQSERDPPPDTAGENAAELNFGFELVERLTDNIGLLVVKTLSAAEEPGAAHAPSAAITFIAHTTR